METSKNNKVASGFLKQGSILAVASILVRLIGMIYRIPMANIIGDEGNGSAIRDYIYIEDLANIFYQLINKDVCNETINLGSGRGFSVNDVLAFLKIISKADFKIEYKNARPVDVSNMVLDIEKMKQFVDVTLTPMLDGISSFYHESIKI